MRREYAGSDPELTPDELAALHVAANLVRVQGLPTEAAFWKLGGAQAVHAARTSRSWPCRPTRSVGPLFRAVSERSAHGFATTATDRVARAATIAAQPRPLVPLRLRPRTAGRASLPCRPHRRPVTDGRAAAVSTGPARHRADPSCGPGSSATAIRSSAPPRRRGPGAVGVTSPRQRRRSRERADGSVVLALTVRNRDRVPHRSCSRSSTTPRCSTRRSCAPTSSTGYRR